MKEDKNVFFQTVDKVRGILPRTFRIYELKKSVFIGLYSSFLI